MKEVIPLKSFEAKLKAILIADNPETFVTRRIPEVNLQFGGMEGDRHFGMTCLSDSRQPMYPRGTEILNRRQITIVSEGECALIAEELGVEYVLPEWLGANLFLSGFLKLTELSMGSRILFPSGAGLICMGENKPCTLPGEVIQKHYENDNNLTTNFVRAGYKRRGIVCAVERPGRIIEGDEARILINDFTNPMQ